MSWILDEAKVTREELAIAVVDEEARVKVLQRCASVVRFVMDHGVLMRQDLCGLEPIEVAAVRVAAQASSSVEDDDEAAELKRLLEVTDGPG